jgi:hypothetical protein
MKSDTIIFFLLTFILGLLLGAGLISSITSSQLKKSNLAVTSAQNSQAEAEALAKNYEFTVQKLSTILMTKCNKVNTK